MAKAQAAKKGATKKRRERKNIEKGAAHIRASFNNTIVTITCLLYTSGSSPRSGQSVPHPQKDIAHHDRPERKRIRSGG